MQAIASDGSMSEEMATAMMHDKYGISRGRDHKGMTISDRNEMAKMLHGNPGLMQPILSAMMESVIGDTRLMSAMITTMRGNLKTMVIMQKMNGTTMMNSMKMEGMHDGHKP